MGTCPKAQLKAVGTHAPQRWSAPGAAEVARGGKFWSKIVANQSGIWDITLLFSDFPTNFVLPSNLAQFGIAHCTRHLAASEWAQSVAQEWI